MEINGINSDKSRLTVQIEKFNTYKHEIEKIIQKIEEEYEINIFYASETGSRGLGIDVEDSDFDITGFFIPKNELEYFKIIKKYDKTIKITQDKAIINDRVYEVDIELWDIKHWLCAKVSKNTTGCDFWFESSLIYKNSYPDVVEEMRKHILPPHQLYWGKAKSGMVYNTKDIKNKGECLNKSLMNVLTSLFQYAHYQMFEQTFPNFNILEEIDFLRKNKEMVICDSKFLTEEEFKILEECIEVYYELFEQKKKGRKSMCKEIPICISRFREIIERKFVFNKNSQIEEELAQGWFDDLLSRK